MSARSKFLVGYCQHGFVSLFGDSSILFQYGFGEEVSPHIFDHRSDNCEST